MWFSYIKERIIENQELVNNLIKIDENNVGYNISIDYLVQFLAINKKISNYFKEDLDNNTFITEGNPISLLAILNDSINKNIDIFINEENVAINIWIIKTYNEFLDEYNFIKPNIILKSNFDIKTDKAIVIGSESFCLEMNKCLNKSLTFYEDE